MLDRSRLTFGNELAAWTPAVTRPESLIEIDRASREEFYPPFDGTLLVAKPAHLLGHHADLIADILQASSLPGSQAKELVAQPIEAFVRHVGTLPATRDAFYAGKGGLLRLGLDCALLTARKAQVSEFSGFGHIERRRLEAPRWRLACILAALCYDLHRTVTQYAVSAEDGTSWTPLYQPLADFATSKSADRLLLAWRDRGAALSGRSELAWNTPLANRLIREPVLRFLYEGDPEILAHFYSVISGEAANQASNVIRPLVEDARARLIARDQATDPMRFGKRGLGTSLGPYLADGLRQLKKSGHWTVNGERARVWVARGTVFLIWPLAAKEIRAWLEEIKLPGVPRDDHTIAEFLADAKLIVARGGGATDAASLLWPIRLPGGREVQALRLSSADVLFPEGELPDAQELQIVAAPELHANLAARPITSPGPPATQPEALAPAPALPAKRAYVPEASSGIEEAVKILDYPTQLLVKELGKLLARPKAAKGYVNLRPDGTLSLRCDWIATLGFDATQIASKLNASGWLVAASVSALGSGGDKKGGETIVFQPRIARLLIGRLTEGDLLSTLTRSPLESAASAI